MNAPILLSERRCLGIYWIIRRSLPIIEITTRIVIPVPSFGRFAQRHFNRFLCSSDARYVNAEVRGSSAISSLCAMAFHSSGQSLLHNLGKSSHLARTTIRTFQELLVQCCSIHSLYAVVCHHQWKNWDFACFYSLRD